MSERKVNRSKRVHVRFTDEEFEKIKAQFTRSTCRKLSEYVRRVLLNKPVTMNQRNQSLDDFMAEMIALRNELNAIGNNYNQTVKRLHTLEDVSEIKTWLMINEAARKIIQNKIAEIKEKINQIDDIWLH
jgi:glutaminase